MKWTHNNDKKHTRSRSLVYIDANFSGSVVDCWSPITYCTFIFDILVSWKSSKQDKVSCSSAEVEYWALVDGASEGHWIYGILRKLCVKYAGSIHFFCDNKSAIALAKNPSQKDHIKHMEWMDEGIFNLEDVASSEQAVDVLTKGLSSPLLIRATAKLDMDDIHTSLGGGGC